MGHDPCKRGSQPRDPAGQVQRERLTHEVNCKSRVKLYVRCAAQFRLISHGLLDRLQL